MRSLFLLLLSLLSFIFTLTHATTDYQNALTCAKRNPALNTAIATFCNRRGPKGHFLNNLVVPSPYASRGSSIPGNAHVRILGECHPKQWVPLQYCSPQFHDMCAKGVRRRRYGRKGCQVWLLEGLDTGRVAGIVGDAAGRKGVGSLVGGMRGR